MYYQKSKIVLQLRCTKEVSVFTGESVAILEACLYTKCHNISKALLQDPLHNKLNSLLILTNQGNLLKSYRNGRMVQLVWIPSHSVILGNECADSLV